MEAAPPPLPVLVALLLSMARKSFLESSLAFPAPLAPVWLCGGCGVVLGGGGVCVSVVLGCVGVG